MVLHVSAVHAFAYYDALAADTQRLVDRARRTLARERATRRDGLGYYDHGAEEGVGTFERLCRGDPDALSLFAGLDSGTIAETMVIRRIADRRHPRTGRKLPIMHRTRWLTDKEKHAQQVVGHDIQMSAPKDVGVLWGFASLLLRVRIAAAHHRAVAKVLAFIRDNGLIEARSGQDGWRREPVNDALIARYFHRLSRANDPHLHSHCVLMNICRRADGSIGTVDTGKVVAFASAMTELYRAELAAILSRELGLEIRQEAHGFSIPAIPEAVVTLFSKRRIAIEEEAEARGFAPAKDRKAAQKVSKDTRRSKSKGVTADTLRAGWEQEARDIGHDPEGFMTPVEAACALHTSSPIRADRLAGLDQDRLIEVAFAHDARLSWPDLLARVTRQVLTDANADEAVVLAEALRERLILLPEHDHGEPVYTTAAIVKAEHDLLKRAVSGRFRWTQLDHRQVEAALKAFPSLSEEQRSAVRHALNRDRISIVNGSAGSGKSFMSFSIARVAEQHGLRVIGTSAAWTAAHVLRREAGLGTDDTYSLAKLMAAIAKGDLVLNDSTVLIVDEAGMAPLTVIADLVRVADEAGSKIIMVGDVRQLQPVAFGAPMRALAAELGFAEMVGIRRQRQDWMREASIELAAHRPDRAVDAYDAAGCLKVHTDRSATLAAAADDYLRQVRDDLSADALRQQLLITPRNRDVAELNRLVRERLQADDRLGPDLVRIKTLTRGRRAGSEPVEVPLAVGDRIVFGARLELGSRTIFNSDVARIMAIDAHRENPRLTFVLDRADDQGQPLSFMVRYRELVSRFSEASVPELQHAYAMTAHGAQGATVERAVLVDIEGLNTEASYVGMTRHREQLSLHLNAGKSLSRHRREVIRLSRRNELIDDDAPEHAAVILTRQERDAAVALAKARMRRPQPDPNPSFHVFDKAAWLAATDPVGEFRRQAARRGGRGGDGRMVPKTPEIATLGDPTILSTTEIARLDSIPLDSEPVLKAFQLQAIAPDRLHHAPSGHTIAIDGNRPDWSDEQRRNLSERRAMQDHPLVQMAILLLQKPLRWARAWVRRGFGLRSLNPLAGAAHAEDRHIRDRQDAREAAAPQLWSARTIAAESGDKEKRRHRRFQRWQAIAASHTHSMPKSANAIEVEERSAGRRRRYERWAAMDAETVRLSDLSSSMQPGLDDVKLEERGARRQRRYEKWAAVDAETAPLSDPSMSPQPGLDAAAESQPRSRDSDRRPADTLIDGVQPVSPGIETPPPPSIPTVERRAESSVAASSATAHGLEGPGTIVVSIPAQGMNAPAQPNTGRPNPPPRISTFEEMEARTRLALETELSLVERGHDDADAAKVAALQLADEMKRRERRLRNQMQARFGQAALQSEAAQEALMAFARQLEAYRDKAMTALRERFERHRFEKQDITAQARRELAVLNALPMDNAMVKSQATAAIGRTFRGALDLLHIRQTGEIADEMAQWLEAGPNVRSGNSAPKLNPAILSSDWHRPAAQAAAAGNTAQTPPPPPSPQADVPLTTPQRDQKSSQRPPREKPRSAIMLNVPAFTEKEEFGLFGPRSASPADPNGPSKPKPQESPPENNAARNKPRRGSDQGIE